MTEECTHAYNEAVTVAARAVEMHALARREMGLRAIIAAFWFTRPFMAERRTLREAIEAMTDEEQRAVRALFEIGERFAGYRYQ